MVIEEAKSKVGPGWHDLINHYHEMMNRLSEPTIITDVTRRLGMLFIIARPLSDDPFVQEILNRLAWSVERDSVKVCEICGSRGYRRKIIPEMPNLCSKHYVEMVNRISDDGGLVNVGNKIEEYILNF